MQRIGRSTFRNVRLYSAMSRPGSLLVYEQQSNLFMAQSILPKQICSRSSMQSLSSPLMRRNIQPLYTTRLMSSEKQPKDAPSSEPIPTPVNPNVAQQQLQRLQRVVTDLNLGDQVSVMLISVFTLLILASPYIVRQVKNLSQDDYDEFWASSDVIDDLSKLARTEWGKEEEIDADGENKGVKNNAIEKILQDVLQSQTLQQAAQQFCVTVITSEPVKKALNKLLGELFKDLINDQETIAQVIQLLNKVIQDEGIKRAVQHLILDIIDEPEVKNALVDLVQQLARNDPIPTAVTELLKESAHATLNDADIFDHSMEFATDVLGDDIVQRTAGEALRNTVGHAVRPASTVVFTTFGLVLLMSSILAVGYARSTEQEVHLFEIAAKSFANNASLGIQRILSWPGQMVESVGVFCLSIILFPVRVARAIGERSLAWSQQRFLDVFSELSWMPSWALRVTSTRLSAAGTWVTGNFARAISKLSSVLLAGIKVVTRSIRDSLSFVSKSSIVCVAKTAVENIRTSRALGWLLSYGEWQRLCTRINMSLTRLSNSIEALLGRLVGYKYA